MLRLRRILLLAAMVAWASTSCSNAARKPQTFNPLPTEAASAPASPDAVPARGSSKITITGEVGLVTSQDFQCSYATDDFFIRGKMGDYAGVPMYMSLNVEFYKRPGTYTRRTQVLVRRISADSTFYASWYVGTATATVLPNGRGADIATVTVPPEQGTQATKPIQLGGHFGCLAPPAPGPG